MALTGGGIAAIPWFANATPSPTLTVAQDGTGQFKTVQAAVNAVPAGSARTIVIGKGTYHEVVKVPANKTRLKLVGATGNPEDVVIAAGNASGTPKPGGGTYGTEGSATATFSAADFTAVNLTIANTFSPVANPSITQTQAVAVAAEGDRQVFQNDRFLGRQDTLLAWSPNATAQTRQYFRDDFVAGTVDFLFGNATAVFDRDNLQAIDTGAAAGGVGGVLTAANTEASKKYGFLITNSRVYASGAANTVFLGRPWHPTSTAVAQVVIRNTVLPAAIKSATPWTDMSGFSWKSARFSEYANTGPGATVNGNRPQLTSAQAGDYTAQKYLAGTDGWNPTGGVITAVPGTSPTSTPTTTGTATPTPVSTSTPPSSVAGISLATGDSRKVTQPVIPSVCATLTANLTMTKGVAGSADETTPPDTARIQRALDGCRQSGSGSVAVKLLAGSGHNAFLTGPLTIGRGVVLLVDSGVTVYGSRNPANYQVSGKPTCGTVASGEGGCAPLIAVSGANAGVDGVRAGNGHQGTIDARGGATLIGKSVTWWDLAHLAQVNGGNQQNPRLLQATNSDNFTLYDINLLNSPNFHVVYQGGNGFTAWGVRIKTPATARNTDGIDPGGSTNVTINDSYIEDGDDGIAVKGGNAVSNITVENSHFYGTHGISIGSETNGGVTNIVFRNNTLTGTDSFGNVSGSSTGIRIKSSPKNGGEVTRVTYLGICLSAVRAPIVFDTHYANGTGSLTPYFHEIVVDGLRAMNSPSGATSVFQGYSSAYPLGLAMENVQLDATKNTAGYADIATYQTDLTFAGTGVVTKPFAGSGSIPTCSFPVFPAL